MPRPVDEPRDPTIAGPELPPRSPWSSIASMRDWLVGPAVSAAEAEDFAAHTRELTARLWPGLGFVIGFAALLWWPVDRLVYAESATIQGAFADFRIRIFIVDVTVSLVMPWSAFARRHAHFFAALAAISNLLLAGWLLGAAGQGDVQWLYYAFMTPVFSVLLVLPLRIRVWVASAFTTAIFAAWLAHPLTRWSDEGVAAGLSYLVFCTGLGIFIGHLLYVQVQRSFLLARRVDRQRLELETLAARLEERVSEQTEVIRDLSARAQEIRAEQRLEIGRELHDGLGQELTSMRLLVDLGVRIHDDPEVVDAFSSLGEQILRIQGSLRQVLESLRPQLLEERSLVESLAILTGELERRSGLECRFVRDGPLGDLPSAQSLALYRIAQEGLTNAIRHARAHRLELRLEARPGEVTLEVRDDGMGIAAEHVGHGFGTRGISERTLALGGRATWEVDGGTCLTVTLPIRRGP